MPALAHHPSFVQDDDLVRVLDRCHPLGDDQDGGISCLLFECFSQGRVGPEVQGRETVVKDKDRGLFYQSPGNSQPLPLATGDIRTPLGDLCGKTLWSSKNELAGLGNVYRLA